jgi:hypothetical protein
LLNNSYVNSLRICKGVTKQAESVFIASKSFSLFMVSQIA